jgi:hypothetical protein
MGNKVTFKTHVRQFWRVGVDFFMLSILLLRNPLKFCQCQMKP